MPDLSLSDRAYLLATSLPIRVHRKFTEDEALRSEIPILVDYVTRSKEPEFTLSLLRVLHTSHPAARAADLVKFAETIFTLRDPSRAKPPQRSGALAGKPDPAPDHVPSTQKTHVARKRATKKRGRKKKTAG